LRSVGAGRHVGDAINTMVWAMKAFKPYALLDRVRDSQFLVPALFIVASIALVFAANLLNGNLTDGDIPYLVPATIPSARTMLGTIAGAIITVAAVVFSLTALTVQMAASQYSPRVIQGFLRDRFQQVVLGVVIGTFTFALVGLASLGADPADGARADWTATIGVVLGVGSALLIVAYIDHVTRRIRIDDTIKRLAGQTEAALRQMPESGSSLANQSWQIGGDIESSAVRSTSAGWVQRIDLAELAEALPPGAIGRIEQLSGTYAVAGTRLLTVWQEGGAIELDTDRARNAFTIGGTRAIDRDDPAFGVRLLVDIALRALSPGINDPATAADVVRHLAGPIRSAYLDTEIHGSYVHANGTRLAQPGVLQPSDYVHLAYSEIRFASAGHATVLMALAESLTALHESLNAAGVGAPAIERELELVRHTVDASPLVEADRRPILTVLNRTLD